MDALLMNASTATSSKVLVEKRDGRVVDFDPMNIISAVKSAFADLDKQVGPEEEKLIRGFADQIEGEITERYNGPAKIEDIQNLVEHALIDAHLYDVARAYTNYRLDKDIQRAKHGRQRGRLPLHQPGSDADPREREQGCQRLRHSARPARRRRLQGRRVQHAAPGRRERAHEGRHPLP